MNKFLKSFSYAFSGLVIAFKEQLNMKIHAVACLVVIVFGFYVEITSLEWCILTLTMAVVIALELINTAIENLVDLVSSTQNPHAGKIKDIAAAAVLLAATGALGIGIVIFKKYLI